MSSELDPRMPPRFVDLKLQIATSYPDFEARVTTAWKEILQHLEAISLKVAEAGPEIVPQVNFTDLSKLKQEDIDLIKQRGCIVIRDIVDDAEAASWKTSLERFVKANPDVPGLPEDDKQFFHLYWTKEQVLARSHPNMLAATAWLNKLYTGGVDGADLSTPLTYADRFRIRHPGPWQFHPPHVDGGAIERWEDDAFRTCFADILNGNWKNHNPYDLSNRMKARHSIYGRSGQASIFRTFQGWLAISETGPGEGTLQVFPDVIASNAYMILRPFFRPKATPVSEDPLSAENWEYDISTPDFPGIYARDQGFVGPRPNPESHPHMRLGKTMVSVPKVNPGDTVFWHSDVVHAVETVNKGTYGDSAVMYIPAVPSTPQNLAYVQKQKEAFVQGITPPDFAASPPETNYVGVGKPEDIMCEEGRLAMGF